ncbi:MAG: hypothetical protein ACOCXG_05845 [Nanoarchaeota archaeon]
MSDIKYISSLWTNGNISQFYKELKTLNTREIENLIEDLYLNDFRTEEDKKYFMRNLIVHLN